MHSLIRRILIVGLGSIGKRHLRIARMLMPKADIRVLRRPMTSEVPKDANGCFFGIEDAVDFSPQIAVIASPSPFHIATAEILAKVGAHLLIEKPLSSSLDGIPQLIQTCKNQKIVMTVDYNLRFFSSLQFYRELLGKCTVGKVLSVRCEVGQYLPSWRTDGEYKQGVSARRELGGGALLELSHELDYLRWIFGEVEWVKATLSKQSDLDINVEDTVHLTLGLRGDSSGYQLIAQVNLDFIRHDRIRTCIAIGDKGSLSWNGLTGAVDICKEGSNEWQQLFQHTEIRDDSYIAEWRNFLESIEECKTPLISGLDGLKVMEIIEAARQSNISGGVRINLKDLRVQGEVK